LPVTTGLRPSHSTAAGPLADLASCGIQRASRRRNSRSQPGPTPCGAGVPRAAVPGCGAGVPPASGGSRRHPLGEGGAGRRL